MPSKLRRIASQSWRSAKFPLDPGSFAGRKIAFPGPAPLRQVISGQIPGSGSWNCRRNLVHPSHPLTQDLPRMLSAVTLERVQKYLVNPDNADKLKYMWEDVDLYAAHFTGFTNDAEDGALCICIGVPGFFNSALTIPWNRFTGRFACGSASGCYVVFPELDADS